MSDLSAIKLADSRGAEPNRADGAREMPPVGREGRVQPPVATGREPAAGFAPGLDFAPGAPGASAAPGAASRAAFSSAPSPSAGEPLFTIDESSDLPLWVQLRNRLAHLIRTGYFRAGEQLPSLRSLSAEAKINYNTVTKAYRDLETSGLIVSVRGRGMYVQKNVTVDDSPETAVDAMAEQCVEEYRACGMTFRDIHKRLAGIVQAKADEAAAAAAEKGGYYDRKY